MRVGLTRLRRRMVGFGLYDDRGPPIWIASADGRPRSVPLRPSLRQPYGDSLPLFGPLQARAVLLYHHPWTASRIVADRIDPRVCATVEPGRTFDHGPSPSVCLHFHRVRNFVVLPRSLRGLSTLDWVSAGFMIKTSLSSDHKSHRRAVLGVPEPLEVADVGWDHGHRNRRGVSFRAAAA